MEKRFGIRIFSLIFLVMAGMLAAGLVSMLILGDPQMLESYDFSDASSRNKFRLALFFGHLLSFLIPGIIYLYMNYRDQWKNYLSPDRNLIAYGVFMCILFLFVSYPLVAYGAELNARIPFPDFLKTMDENTLQTMMGILNMEHFSELLFSLVLVAVLPAFGEELLFRGIFQNELEKSTGNGHLAIAIAAFVFGVIHLQAESFIPKILLGFVLGYCYFWTRNIWVPIIIHFINNGFQILALYFAGDQIETLEQIETPEVPVWSAFLSLILLYWVGGQIIKTQSKPDHEPGA